MRWLPFSLYSLGLGLRPRRSWSAGLPLSALLGLMLWSEPLRSLGAGLLLGPRPLPLDGEGLLLGLRLSRGLLLGLRLSRGLLLGLRLSRGLIDRLSSRVSLLGDRERLCKEFNVSAWCYKLYQHVRRGRNNWSRTQINQIKYYLYVWHTKLRPNRTADFISNKKELKCIHLYVGYLRPNKSK